jgi:hypothetical protein
MRRKEAEVRVANCDIWSFLRNNRGNERGKDRKYRARERERCLKSDIIYKYYNLLMEKQKKMLSM